MPEYTIIVPVFNEAGAIEGAIERLNSIPDVASGRAAVVLVDDGSTDGSSEAMARLIEGRRGFSSVRHRKNRGYGAALKSGIRAAKGNIIVITDADNTYPDHRIPALVEMMSDYDMVVGARTGANVRIPLIRKPAKWIIGKLANYLSGTRIPDLNSGLRVMRRDVIERFMNILPDGFSFTTTITLAMLTNGYGVHYEPIDYYHREGKSKIRPIKDTLNFVQLIIRTIMYFDPLKIFLPLSFMLLGASIATFVLSAVYLDKIMDTTTAILFIGGIQVLAIGMLADLVDKRSRQ